MTSSKYFRDQIFESYFSNESQAYRCIKRTARTMTSHLHTMRCVVKKCVIVTKVQLLL